MKRIQYRATRGQEGRRGSGGGFLTDGPNWSLPRTPVADFPEEVPFFVFPKWTQPDAVLANARDDDQRTQVAPQFVIESIRMAFGAAFAAAAASFNVLVRRYTSAGVLVGTVATMFNGVADTAVAGAMVEKTGANLANTKCDPGDVLTVQVTVNGAGAVCPAQGGYVDIQA